MPVDHINCHHLPTSTDIPDVGLRHVHNLYLFVLRRRIGERVCWMTDQVEIFLMAWSLSKDCALNAFVIKKGIYMMVVRTEQRDKNTD
jgi:hypothetical protein